VFHGGGQHRRERAQEYWDWLAVVLFVLITVDMVTTVYAVHVVGPIGGSTPFVRWSLLSGTPVSAAVTLVALVIAVVLFDHVVELLRRTPEPYERYFAAAIETWLGGLLAAGLIVFANNLTVIFFGESLIVATGIPGL
jgi:hypothetical protein